MSALSEISEDTKFLPATQPATAASKIRNFEDVLEHVGSWGRYQKMQLLIFLPLTLYLSYVCYSPILFLYTPDHWCSPDPLSASPRHLTDEHGRRSSCLMYDGDDTNATTKCRHGWTYNFTGYFRTMTSDMDWVCDDAWRPASTQAVFYAGGMVGTLGFGYTADHYGRKWTFLASNALLAVAALATPFCASFVAFAAARFVMGLANLTFFSVFFLLSLEYLAVEKRAFVGNLSLAIGLTVGGCYQPWLIRWLGEWKTFHHALYLQTLLLLAFAPRFMRESVRWLASKGRVDECLVILQDIARMNGRTMDSGAQEGFKKMVQLQILSSEGQVEATWIDLFRTPRLRRNVCLMVLTWMLISSMFDGHIRNIANLRYSIYTTFTLSCALELPADLLAMWGLNYFGRRWSAFGSLALSAACMFSCALFLGHTFWVTVSAMIGRFFITYAMNTGAQISFEIVPTVLRGQGNALANVFAQASQFFAPFIVYSSVYSPRLPFLILGLGASLGAAVSIFLPETAGEDLPDTIEEAEQFGLEQKLWQMPCIRQRRARARRLDDAAEPETT